MNCSICGKPVDPTAKSTLQRIEAWERKALSGSRRGGSDVVNREHQQVFAHSHCVENERHGIAHEQETLAW